MKFLLALLLLAAPAIAQQQAPELTLQSADGADVDVKSYFGKGPVQISFWALWCEPCKQELKVMAKVYDRLKDSGYTLVSICEDNQKSVAKVRGYASARGWNFPVLLDPNGEALRLFNGLTIPFSILIDKDGKIHSTHVGYLPGDEANLEEEIRSLLAHQ